MTLLKSFLYLSLPLLLLGAAGETLPRCEKAAPDANMTDLKQLIKSCTDAFEKGSGDEMTSYRIGYALEKTADYPSALKWLKRSARSGYPGAYRELALMVEKGEGVKRDRDLALMLYLVAIRPDNRRYFDPSDGERKGDIFEEIPELQSRVSVWPLLELSQQNNPLVFVHLGYAYLNGKYGAEVSEGKAFYWLMRAAEKGDRYARIELAKLCLGGIGLKEECEQVFDWNLKLAHEGDSQAQYLTGMRYYRAVGVPKDEERARWWFSHSAERNDSDAGAMLRVIDREKKRSEGNGTLQESK